MKVKFWKALLDLVERAGATFAQTFLAIMTAPNVNDALKNAHVNTHVSVELTTNDALKYAAIAGLYATAKFLLVRINAYLKK